MWGAHTLPSSVRNHVAIPSHCLTMSVNGSVWLVHRLLKWYFAVPPLKKHRRGAFATWIQSYHHSSVSPRKKTRIVEGPLLCEAAVEGGQNPSPSKWLIFIIYLIKFKQEKTHLVNCQSFRGFFPSGPTLFKSIFVYLSQSTSTFNHSWC